MPRRRLQRPDPRLAGGAGSRPAGLGGAVSGHGQGKAETNRLQLWQLTGAEPLLFMFPHFKSDVKGVSFSSACAINFKVLCYGKNACVCVCVCVPALSLGTPLSGEPKTHFLFSGIHFNNLKYLVARCIREALSLMRAAKISIPPPPPNACVCTFAHGPAVACL